MTTKTSLYRFQFSSMGCPAELCVYASSVVDANRALDLSNCELRRLEHKYSHYSENSVLAEIVRQANMPGGTVVDKETAAILDFATSQFQQSNGRFDITAGTLTRLWENPDHVPTDGEIDLALKSTGWSKALWDGSRLQLRNQKKLDLGGIVKEYAADRVAVLLRRTGISAGFINLGGDLYVIGPHPGGESWNVGIRHPRSGGVLASIEIRKGGLATSGDYERYRIVNGQRFSHLLDARNGRPVQGLASVSVLAASSLMAGAISTLAMLLGKAQGLEFLSGSGHCWLAHDGTRCFSSSSNQLLDAQV